MERDILKKSHCVLCEGDSCPVRTDDDAAPPVSTGPAVSVLEVSRSGYHAWRTGRPSTRAQENALLTRRPLFLGPL